MSARKGNFEGTIAAVLLGTVSEGTFAVHGGVLGMYMKDGVIGDTVPFLIQGYVKKAPKADSQAWVAGDLLYWDASNSCFTTTYKAGGVKAIAAKAVAVTAGLVTGDVVLNPALTGGFKMARGVHTTVAAVDTIVTGLNTVIAVVGTLASDPLDDPEAITTSIGDQAGAPAAGSIYIKSWKNGATDPTLVAATTFGKLVNWIAIGT